MNPINDKKLIEALDLYGQDIIAELGKQLIRANKKASGKLIRSLDYKVRKVVSKMVIDIEAESYLEYVDSGRPPGKQPPLRDIQKWTRLKGINIKAAFPIARAIGRFGVKPTNVIDKTFKQVERGRKYRRFEEGYTDWVDTVIDDYLIKLSSDKNIVIE